MSAPAAGDDPSLCNPASWRLIIAAAPGEITAADVSFRDTMHPEPDSKRTVEEHDSRRRYAPAKTLENVCPHCACSALTGRAGARFRFACPRCGLMYELTAGAKAGREAAAHKRSSRRLIPVRSAEPFHVLPRLFPHAETILDCGTPRCCCFRRGCDRQMVRKLRNDS